MPNWCILALPGRRETVFLPDNKTISLYEIDGAAVKPNNECSNNTADYAAWQNGRSGTYIQHIPVHFARAHCSDCLVMEGSAKLL